MKQYPAEKVLRLLWVYSQVQYEHPGLALDSKLKSKLPPIETASSSLVSSNVSIA